MKVDSCPPPSSPPFEPVSDADGPDTIEERETASVIELPEVVTPQPSRRALLLRGTLWQGVAQFVPLVGNLVLTPYIITGLGKEVYAAFLLITTLQALMGTVDGGIGPSANRYFTVYAGAGDRAGMTRLLSTLVLIISLATLVVLGVFSASADALLNFFPSTRIDPTGSAFLLHTMIVLVGLNQVRNLFAAVLFAHHRFGVTTAMLLLGYLVYVAGLVWTIQTHRGLTGIAWMFMVQQGIATLFIIPSACRFLTRRGVGVVSAAQLREFFGYSWKAQLSSLLDGVAQYGDQFIVQRFRSSEAVPFGQGASFAQQLRTVPLNAYAPVQAMVGRAVGAQGPEAALGTFERIQRPWVIGVAGWMAAGAPAAYFGVNAWLHAPLGGSTLPGTVASILLVGSLFQLVSVVQVIWCLAVGRSDLELRYGIVALVLNLAGTVALIIPFGVAGSVAATAASQLVAAVYLVRVMGRHLAVVPSSPFRHVPTVHIVVTALVSFTGTWAASHLAGHGVPYGALSLLVCGLGAAPALVLYAVWALGLGTLRDLLASRLPRFVR